MSEPLLEIKGTGLVTTQDELRHLGAAVRVMTEKLTRTVSFNLNNQTRLHALCAQILEGEELGKPEDVLAQIKKERDELRKEK